VLMAALPEALSAPAAESAVMSSAESVPGERTADFDGRRETRPFGSGGSGGGGALDAWGGYGRASREAAAPEVTLSTVAAAPLCPGATAVELSRNALPLLALAIPLPPLLPALLLLPVMRADGAAEALSLDAAVGAINPARTVAVDLNGSTTFVESAAVGADRAAVCAVRLGGGGCAATDSGAVAMAAAGADGRATAIGTRRGAATVATTAVGVSGTSKRCDKAGVTFARTASRERSTARVVAGTACATGGGTICVIDLGAGRERSTVGGRGAGAGAGAGAAVAAAAAAASTTTSGGVFVVFVIARAVVSTAAVKLAVVSVENGGRPARARRCASSARPNPRADGSVGANGAAAAASSRCNHGKVVNSDDGGTSVGAGAELASGCTKGSGDSDGCTAGSAGGSTGSVRAALKRISKTGDRGASAGSSAVEHAAVGAASVRPPLPTRVATTLKRGDVRFALSGGAEAESRAAETETGVAAANVITTAGEGGAHIAVDGTIASDGVETRSSAAQMPAIEMAPPSASVAADSAGLARDSLTAGESTSRGATIRASLLHSTRSPTPLLVLSVQSVVPPSLRSAVRSMSLPLRVSAVRPALPASTDAIAVRDADIAPISAVTRRARLSGVAATAAAAANAAVAVATASAAAAARDALLSSPVSAPLR
jgi:hypothetical protein